MTETLNQNSPECVLTFGVHYTIPFLFPPLYFRCQHSLTILSSLVPLVVCLGGTPTCAQTTLPQGIDTVEVFDLFPLAINNQWIYSHHAYCDGHSFYSSCDGTKQYVIVGSIETADSTLWNFVVYRELFCTTCFQTDCTNDTINDSYPLVLIERHTALHQLFNPAINFFEAYPFFQSSLDTNQIVCRYNVNELSTLSLSSAPTCEGGSGNLQFQAQQGELSYDIVCPNGIEPGGCTIHFVLLDAVINSVNPAGISPDKAEFYLRQNYPNPFNPSTTISFVLSHSGEVSLKIFNVLGEEVATLVSGPMDAGIHSLLWDATGQPGGVYFYRLRAVGFVETKKLLLLR